MEKIRELDRRELIQIYLEGELHKKGTPVPESIGTLDWDDVNAIDQWLSLNGYKNGIISGFRRWAYVQLSLEDLLSCSVYGGHFPGHTNCSLGALARSGALAASRSDRLDVHGQWVRPKPVWFDLLSQAEFDERYAITLRPACRGVRRQGAKFYVEDGGGRAVLYTQACLRLQRPSQMTGYIGFDPDPASQWLKRTFRGELLGRQYATLEQVLQPPRSWPRRLYATAG
jgi:hypothetical protein